MSYILELACSISQEDTFLSKQAIKNLLRSTFMNQCFFFKDVVESQSQIVFYLLPSLRSYRLATMWVFYMQQQNFKFQISFYNNERNDLLRAYTQRMKIQVLTLTRLINDSILPYYSFKVDSFSGTLKLQYTASWLAFSQLMRRKQNVFNLIINTFLKIRQYDELMLFLQPIHINGIKKIDLSDHFSRINRYRFLLKRTPEVNQKLRACLGDSFKIKNLLGVPLQNVQLLKNLLIDNIYHYQMSLIGLGDADFQYKDESSIQETFKKQTMEITKNQNGITSMIKKSNIFETDKILFGLLKIKQLTPKINNQIQNSQQKKQDVDQGGHSLIKRKFFNYVVADTINQATQSFNRVQKQSNKKKHLQDRGYLVYKLCNIEKQASINSFKNQLAAIKYMRDMASPFIATYYLLVKDFWNEKDIIYMKSYKKNLLSFLMQNKLISLKTKLEIAYKIGKGLCFLYSKKIVHRDFKPQNIVIDSKITPKIIDFGSCAPHYTTNNLKVHDLKILTTKAFNVHLYNLPQNLDRNVQGSLFAKFKRRQQYEQHPLFDIYAFGKTLSLMFFKTLSPVHPQSLDSQPHSQFLKNIIFIVDMCCNVDPDDRPGFGEVTAYLGSLKQLLKKQLKQPDDNKNPQDQTQLFKLQSQKSERKGLQKKQEKQIAQKDIQQQKQKVRNKMHKVKKQQRQPNKEREQ